MVDHLSHPWEGNTTLNPADVAVRKRLTDHPKAIQNATVWLQETLRRAEDDATRKCLDEALADMEVNRSMENYNTLHYHMALAERKGRLDLSSIQKLMPWFEKDALRSDVDKALKGMQADNNMIRYAFLKYAVDRAEEKGVHMPEVASRMLEFKRSALRHDMESTLYDTKKSVNEVMYRILEKKIREAKQSGVDVSSVQAQMPELKRQIIPYVRPAES